MTTKEKAIKTIQELPDSVSWADIEERIRFLAAIDTMFAKVMMTIHLSLDKSDVTVRNPCFRFIDPTYRNYPVDTLGEFKPLGHCREGTK